MKTAVFSLLLTLLAPSCARRITYQPAEPFHQRLYWVESDSGKVVMPIKRCMVYHDGRPEECLTSSDGLNWTPVRSDRAPR